MPNLQSLGLTTESVGEALDYAGIPEQMGGQFADPPQPGSYRFKFPAKMDAVWEKFDHVNGKPPGVRIRAKFDEANPLTIIQSPGGKMNGEPFSTSITNAERRRGKRDDPTAPYVSDMDYIFKDVFGLDKKPVGGNVAYAMEFQKHAGQEFSADVTLNWFCNPRKNIYVDNGQGGLSEVEQAGCGTSYYQKDVPKVLANPQDPTSPQVFPVRITCQCGGNIRAFANLERFRK